VIFDGERCIIGLTDDVLSNYHIKRYEFASNFIGGKKILDIACGTGYGSAFLKNAGALKVTGIDISEEAIEYARKHFSAPDIDFQVGNATNILSVGDESVELIVSFETIEHIKEYENYLKEMRRVLKNNGMIILSTPNKKFSSPDTEKPTNPYHFIEFYMDEFTELLGRYFSSVITYGQNHNSGSYKLKRIAARLIPKKIRTLLIPRKFRDAYNRRDLTGITQTDVINCDYFIAVCKK
jgi:ubiquinone/menaquinone biosynthesis C-methylase UbiE